MPAEISRFPHSIICKREGYGVNSEFGMHRRERIQPFHKSPQKVKIEGTKLLYGVPPFERRGTIACDGGGFLTRALERHFTEGETALHLPPEYTNP